MDSLPPVEPKPKSKLPLILGIIAGVLLLCCCIVVVGYAAVRPVISNVFDEIQRDLETNPSTPYNDGGDAGTTGAPVAGGLSDPVLKKDVWDAIVSYEASQGCNSLVSTSITTTQAPDADGVWVEAWGVEACEHSYVYTITFTPDPAGGTYFKASR